MNESDRFDNTGSGRSLERGAEKARALGTLRGMLIGAYVKRWEALQKNDNEGIQDLNYSTTDSLTDELTKIIFSNFFASGKLFEHDDFGQFEREVQEEAHQRFLDEEDAHYLLEQYKKLGDPEILGLLGIYSGAQSVDDIKRRTDKRIQVLNAALLKYSARKEEETDNAFAPRRKETVKTLKSENPKSTSFMALRDDASSEEIRIAYLGMLFEKFGDDARLKALADSSSFTSEDLIAVEEELTREQKFDIGTGK